MLTNLKVSWISEVTKVCTWHPNYSTYPRVDATFLRRIGKKSMVPFQAHAS